MIVIISYNYDANEFLFNFIVFNNILISPYRCHFQNCFIYHVHVHANFNFNVHGRFSFIFRFNFLLFLVIVFWVQ
jgi:hypothetical protein